MDPQHPLSAMNATFSGISQEEKKYLAVLVESLGGVCSRDLTSACTHVFTTTRFSEKARAAKPRNIPVLHPQYLHAVWRMHETKAASRDAADCPVAHESAYVLPPLAGAEIAVTGLAKETRSDLKTLIERLGGRYTAGLTITNTHLLAVEGRGDKHAFARRHGIMVVRPEWLTSSRHDVDVPASQWCQDEAEYLLAPGADLPRGIRQALGPLFDDQVVEETQMGPCPQPPGPGPFSMGNLRSILISHNEPDVPQLKRAGSCPDRVAGDSRHPLTRRGLRYSLSMDSNRSAKILKVVNTNSLDSSALFDRKRGSSATQPGHTQRRFITHAELSTMVEGELQLDIHVRSTAQGATPFLRECQVYLSGFAGAPEREKRMKRILLHGEATRVSHITDLVTHVVFGGICQPDLATLHSLAIRPVLVSVHWLLDSFRAEAMQPCHPFRMEIVSAGEGGGLALSPAPLARWPWQPLPPKEDCSRQGDRHQSRMTGLHTHQPMPGQV